MPVKLITFKKPKLKSYTSITSCYINASKQS